jgi:hypothetical protein
MIVNEELVKVQNRFGETSETDAGVNLPKSMKYEECSMRRMTSFVKLSAYCELGFPLTVFDKFSMFISGIVSAV